MSIYTATVNTQSGKLKQTFTNRKALRAFVIVAIAEYGGDNVSYSDYGYVSYARADKALTDLRKFGKPLDAEGVTG